MREVEQSVISAYDADAAYVEVALYVVFMAGAAQPHIHYFFSVQESIGYILGPAICGCHTPGDARHAFIKSVVPERTAARGHIAAMYLCSLAYNRVVLQRTQTLLGAVVVDVAKYLLR